MRVKLKKGVFVRHCNAESLILCPRTCGCTVLQDAKPIIDELSYEWRDVDDVVRGVANKFTADINEVVEGIQAVIEELKQQCFVDCDKDAKIVSGTADWRYVHEDGSSVNADDEAYRSFCLRHEIPADLHMDLTDACTERCVHCYVPREQHDYLSIELAEKALSEFRDMNGMTVHITGGEAMMHPEFERICSLCVKKNLNLIIFSNMTLCDEEKIVFLREIDPQFLNVSVYSMDSNEHDSITQVLGSWKRTMDALSLCDKYGVHYRVATPLLRANRCAFRMLKKFANVHHVHLIPSIDIVAMSDHNCLNLAHACSPNELETALLSNKGVFDCGWTGEMPVADGKVCDIAEARLYINARGEYYPCDCMHGYVLGNVRDNTLSEIWHGEKLNYLRGLKNRDFGKCASCEHRPWCKVCPAFNFNATGDLFKTIPEKCRVSEVVHRVYGGM